MYNCFVLVVLYDGEETGDVCALPVSQVGGKRWSRKLRVKAASDGCTTGTIETGKGKRPLKRNGAHHVHSHHR